MAGPGRAQAPSTSLPLSSPRAPLTTLPPLSPQTCRHLKTGPGPARPLPRSCTLAAPSSLCPAPAHRLPAASPHPGPFNTASMHEGQDGGGGGGSFGGLQPPLFTSSVAALPCRPTITSSHEAAPEPRAPGLAVAAAAVPRPSTDDAGLGLPAAAVGHGPPAAVQGPSHAAAASVAGVGCGPLAADAPGAAQGPRQSGRLKGMFQKIVAKRQQMQRLQQQQLAAAPTREPTPASVRSTSQQQQQWPGTLCGSLLGLLSTRGGSACAGGLADPAGKAVEDGKA
eukprot:scaffold58884_cov14-Tisochrysis_lutea.AAC.1